jgi:hypothetical protein
MDVNSIFNEIVKDLDLKKENSKENQNKENKKNIDNKKNGKIIKLV